MTTERSLSEIQTEAIALQSIALKRFVWDIHITAESYDWALSEWARTKSAEREVALLFYNTLAVRLGNPIGQSIHEFWINRLTHMPHIDERIETPQGQKEFIEHVTDALAETPAIGHVLKKPRMFSKDDMRRYFELEMRVVLAMGRKAYQNLPENKIPHRYAAGRKHEPYD